MTHDRSNRGSIRNLLVAQFFGAFNDNALKLMVAFLAFRSLQSQYLGNEVELQRLFQFETTLPFCVLTLPLILVSLPAGVLADRLSKRTIIVTMKGAEIGLMAAVTAFLWLFPDNIRLPLLVLGLMGAQSALFSPAKFGILPEILPHERLSSGNAHLQMWTFLAIILGSAAGGLLLDYSGTYLWTVGAVLTLCALIGFVFSRGIPEVPPARSEGRLGETIRSSWTTIRSHRVLGLAVAGSVFYWTVASLLGQDILVYARTVLGLSESMAAIPLAVLGLGVGVGSLLASRLSGQKVEYGLIPLGAVVMAFASLTLALLSPGFSLLLVLMVILGGASGLLLVPLNSLIQWKSPDERRGGIIALSNIFVFSGILAGSVGATLLANSGLSPQAILGAASIVILLGTGWALWLLPEALLRLALILATHTFYRLRIMDSRHVPREGGALLAPNHVSFVDALMLIASLDRPIRFIVHQDYFDYWLFRPFMKSMGCIPVVASGGPRVILKALRDAGRYLEKNELVCIFPEGQITRTGTLLPFRRGLERITGNREAPIIPVYLDRLWGSIFSREGGRFLFKVPRQIPYSVTVAFGNPLPPGTKAGDLRQRVQELASRAWMARGATARPLHADFFRSARRSPFSLALAEATPRKLSRLQAAAGAVVLARALKGFWTDQKNVGILLPPTVAGVLVNIAASLSGRVSVNLNYTAGKAGMESAIRQAGLTTIVSSRLFVKKAELELPQNVDVLWAEDLRKIIGPGLRFSSLVAALLFPLSWLERLSGAQSPIRAQDLATVIFSSGSTGEPKGVMLSHFNVGSNVEALTQVLRATPRDRVLGILPLFHSFGYMSCWFALQKGLGLPVHPNPLDAPAIGDLVQHYRVTILLATPTFLQLYMRRCTPAQFGSLRLVITGAEKLSVETALAFEDHFGVRPMEGYGSTECSPTIAASVPDFRAPGFFQPGSRRGYVGSPLPGVAIKTVHPDTFESLPAGESGMLLVKGPNVMKGYLGRDDLTRKAFREGWYVTGDIGAVDEDGFLKITDRLSRFSKIAGEMVPHGRVEVALQQALGSPQEQVFAVTSIADPRKGESLAVVHTCDPEKIAEVVEKVKTQGLPNLFIPRKDRFVRVARLPLLGTGKLNLREIKQIAQQALETGA